MQFFGPVDESFDISHYLTDYAYSFLPVPVVITESTVDGGLGLMGFFR